MARTILVIVDPSGNPIAGRVEAAGGSSWPFAGWLELLSTLYRALRVDGGEPFVREEQLTGGLR